MSDKQIRFNVEGADRVTRAYEDIRRKQEEITNLSRRSTKEEQVELEKRIKTLKDLQKQQDQNYRDEITRRQLASQQDAVAIREYQLERTEQARGLTGDKRKKFDAETRNVVDEYRRNDIRERQQIINLQRERQEQQTSNKSQVEEIRNVSETIRGEGNKTRRDSSEVLSRVTSGGMNLMGGNLGNILAGFLRFAGPAAAVGALVSQAVNVTNERQRAMVGLSAATDISNAAAVSYSALYREKGLGLSSEEGFAKANLYSRALGGSFLSPTESGNIAGLQISKGFSDQQMQQLLALQRYSGMSVFGQTNVLEEYTRRRDGNIIKLPEILDQYLRVANEILNRTGRVDAGSVQQVLTSIGASYGVSGVQLDRMSSGIVGLGKDQGAGTMRAFRMEALRKLYPGMSTWDMMGIMEDPTRDPKYIESIVNRSKQFGGGGDWTKFFLMSQGFSYEEVNKLMKGDFKLSEMSYGKSDDKMLQSKFRQEGESRIGNIQKIETEIGELKDAVSILVTELLEGNFKVLLPGGLFESAVARGVEVGNSKTFNRRP